MRTHAAITPQGDNSVARTKAKAYRKVVREIQGQGRERIAQEAAAEVRSLGDAINQQALSAASSGTGRSSQDGDAPAEPPAKKTAPPSANMHVEVAGANNVEQDRPTPINAEAMEQLANILENELDTATKPALPPQAPIPGKPLTGPPTVANTTAAGTTSVAASAAGTTQVRPPTVAGNNGTGRGGSVWGASQAGNNSRGRGNSAWGSSNGGRGGGRGGRGGMGRGR